MLKKVVMKSHCFRINAELVREIKIAAAKLNCSMSAVLAAAVEQYLKKQGEKR